MFNWRESPFIRLLLPFVSGILFASQFEQLGFVSYWVLFPLLCLSIVLDSSKYSWRNSFWFACSIHVFLFTFGCLLCFHHNEKTKPDHFQNHLNEENLIYAQIKEMPILEERMKLLVEVLQIGKDSADLKTCSGNLWLYLDYKIPNQELQYGDQILLKSKLIPIPKAQNPEAFDYAHFMHLKNIHYQAFIKPKQWERLYIKKGNILFSTAYALRTKFLGFLKKHLNTENEFAVGAALILGYKEAIGDELSFAYTSTGAMHVLAVSGLHVGFVYLVLSFLLNLIPWRNKYLRWIKTILLLVSIFGFALLTGASPSVLRAATLFGFVALGKLFEREANIYNSLAASAFILLLVNPYLIWDIGFQLSYLAVIGIVYFQSKIYKLWYIENFIGDYAWKLTSVAIAAQITTFPISLYYFHQFPSYFFLSGLVVVPAAVFILSGGMLLFLMEMAFPTLASFVAYFLYGIIWLTNAFIFLLQQIPGGLIAGIWISLGILTLLYLAILSTTLAIHLRKPKWFLVGLSSLILISLHKIYEDFQEANQVKIVCYQLYKNSLIDFIDAKDCISISNEDLAAKNEKFAAQNFRWSKGIQDVEQFNFWDVEKAYTSLIYKKPYLQFYHKVFLFIDPSFKEEQINSLAVDYVYFRNNPKVDFQKLSKKIHFKTVIFDASNYPNKIKKWIKECKNLDLDFKNLLADGALVINLNTINSNE